MKTRLDPRHQKRVYIFKELFAFSFCTQLRDIDLEIKPIIDKLELIDKYIQEAAPEWPIARLNKIDLAILRLAINELLINNDTPPKVVIDEAVEIGKEYGSESTAKFVNGVLGSLLEKYRRDTQETQQKE